MDFDAQGGTSTASVRAYVNEAMPNITPPTKTGYIFGGYYTETNGMGSQYYQASGASAHLYPASGGPTLLYAKWTPITYTVRFDKNGGQGNMNVMNVEYNQIVTLSMNTFTRLGYEFGGWKTLVSSPLGEVEFFDQNSISNLCSNNGESITLYAQWVVAKFVLLYNTNGGTVTNLQQTVEFGAPVTLQTPTRSGYTFLGWFMDGQRYSGGPWTFTENKIVSAKWGYTLTFNPNGGSVETSSLSVLDGETVVAPVPVREGCTFAGWKIGSTAYNGGMWTYTSNQTAVAQWVCNLDVSVNDPLFGSYTGADIGAYAVGSTITLTATPKTGYVFDCWVVNGKQYTTATYSGTINRHTQATACFRKTFGAANVTATNGTIASTLLSVDEDNFMATLRITPETGKYIDEISFDNVAYYKIDSWSTKLYATSTFAQNVAYQANEGNNDLWLTFNYYNTTKAVNVYVKLTTTKYANLSMPKNDGGALDGIAVCANYGGSVTLIGADYETLADSDTIICSAKLAQSGYEFVGWCFYDSQSNILSTEESARFEKSQIYGRQLMAKFQPTADNPDYNMQVDNE